MAKRFAAWNDYPTRKENGKWMCRYCGGVCPGRKRSYCSKDCENEFLIRVSNNALRRCTEERDKGVCASCGLDTWWLANELRDLRRSDRGAWLRQLLELELTPKEALKSLWSADHINPVAEGGGACGLENIQTLCWRCHKRKTAGGPKPKPKRRKGVSLPKFGKARKKAAPPPKKKRGGLRKVGLLFSTFKVEVEDVTKRHKTPCLICEQVPKVGERRLRTERGAGKSSTVEMFCWQCGTEFLSRLEKEVANAKAYLGGFTDDAVRIEDEALEKLKLARKARNEKRKLAKEAKLEAQT